MKVLCMKIISQFKMDSSEEKELALLGFALIMDDDGKKNKKRKHRFWVREIYKKREEQGVFSNLLRELRLDDRVFFQVSFISWSNNFIRMQF